MKELIKIESDILKEDIQKVIQSAINRFTNKTGMTIDAMYVNLHQFQTVGSPTYLGSVAVDFEVSLPQ